MKKRRLCGLILCAAVLMVLSVSISVWGADGMWRMMHGEEDALILGTIQSIDEDYFTVAVEERLSCVSGNARYRMLSGEEIPDTIRIKNDKISHYSLPYYHVERKTGSGDLWYGMKAETGDHILIPVNRDGADWKTFEFGNMMYKVDSTDPKTMKVVLESDYLTDRDNIKKDRLEFADSMVSTDMRATAAMLETFVHSGGVQNEFNSVVTEDGTTRVYASDGEKKTLIYEARTESGKKGKSGGKKR